MSFRYYIGKLPKEEYKKIRTVRSFQELKKFSNKKEDEDKVWLGDLLPTFSEISDEVFKLKKKNDSKYNFFDSKELNEYYNSDYSLFVIDKEDFKELIKLYETIIKRYKLQELKDIEFIFKNKSFKRGSVPEDEVIYTIQDLLRKQKWNCINWNCDEEYSNLIIEGNFDMSKDSLYETSVFELIYFYRTFDFEQNVLYIMGY